MILEVPFVYVQHGYPERTRTEFSGGVLDYVPVKIRELASEEATVVGTCTYFEDPLRILKPDNILFDGEPEETTIEYRMVDGRLMRPLVLDKRILNAPGHGGEMHVEDLDERCRGAIDAISEAQASGKTLFVTKDIAQAAMFMLGFGMEQRRALSLQPSYPGRYTPMISDANWVRQFRRLTRNDRDLCAMEMQKCIQNGAAFIDDVLYVPSGGPALTFAWQPEALKVQVAPELYHLSDRLNSFFGANDIELLTTEVNVIRARHGLGAVADVEVSGSATIDPCVFDYADDLQIRNDIVTILKYQRDTIWEMWSGPAMRAVGDMADYIDGVITDPEAMIEPFRNVAAAYQAKLPDDDPRHHITQMASDLVDRLEARREMRANLARKVPEPSPAPKI